MRLKNILKGDYSKADRNISVDFCSSQTIPEWFILCASVDLEISVKKRKKEEKAMSKNYC